MKKKIVNKERIMNGQVWEQKEHPFHRRQILYWEHIGNDLPVFCLLAGEPLGFCTGREGSKLYTEEQLLSRFEELKYTLVVEAE